MTWYVFVPSISTASIYHTPFSSCLHLNVPSTGSYSRVLLNFSFTFSHTVCSTLIFIKSVRMPTIVIIMPLTCSTCSILMVKCGVFMYVSLFNYRIWYPFFILLWSLCFHLVSLKPIMSVSLFCISFCIY